MPSIPFYGTEADMHLLFGVLSAEADIAFLASAGPTKWRAVKSLPFLGYTRACLWHTTGSPLPLLGAKHGFDRTIEDPWSGWTEERTGNNPLTPYFGPGHYSVIWLNARPLARDNVSIGLSSFEWIGSYYAKAPEITQKYWRRLGRIMKKLAKPIQVKSGIPPFLALPDASKQIESGRKAALNP
jgi:hypothetical protein